MDLCSSKESIQSDDCNIDLQIENFSFEDNPSLEKTFLPKLFNGLYAFSVSIFSNGSSPKYAGYVSLVIKSSMTDNRELTAMASSNSMTCTASVVDVNGEGRYSQSFGMESIMFVDCYIPGLEKFIKRSTLQSQKEEFLPKDVLTMRFEFSFRSNQEFASMRKLSEFLPSLFVNPNLSASGIDKSGLCDFIEIFKDVEEKCNEELNRYIGLKSFENHMTHNKLESSIQTSNNRIADIDASQTLDSELCEEKEARKIFINEMHAENVYQRLGDIICKDSRVQNHNAEETPGCKVINKELANPKEIENEDEASKYNTEKLIKLFDDEKPDESNKNVVVEDHYNELNPPESTEEKLRQLQQTGDDTANDDAKNVIIVVNGHKIFRKTNQLHKNKIHFQLTTDEEMYKLFYSSESLGDDESKSIYRMHGAVPFFTNLMDRDENALFQVVNDKVSFQENTEGFINSPTSLKETCSIIQNDNSDAGIQNDNNTDEGIQNDNNTDEGIQNDNNTDEGIQNDKNSDTGIQNDNNSDAGIQNDNNTDTGEPENFQKLLDKNVCLSSMKHTFNSSEKHIQSVNLGDEIKLTISVKSIGNLEKEVKNEESINTKEKFNECKWNFLIQTSDNVTIHVPFEVDKETIGSKLLQTSVVFSNMLRHPMKERSERRVELSDTSSRTVNNLLSYVDNGRLSDIPLPDAYDLYEAADKYAVKNLMKACADFMEFFPIRENVWSMVKLAEIHSDDYLLELAERVQKLIFRLEQISMKKKNELLGMIRDLVKEVEVSSETKPTQSDFFAEDFNFYQ